MADLNSFVQRLATSEPAGPARAKIAATQGAPHLRDAFSLDRAMGLVVIALVPSLFMALYNTGYQANVDVTIAGLGTAPGWRGAVLGALGIGYDTSSLWAAVGHGALYFVPVLAVTLVVGGLWVRLFAKLRKRPAGEGLMVIALLFALVLPPSIPLWQVALGISFAIVFGREIFGGTGKNFLNPALTGLAFLYVTYPKEMITETAWTVVDAFTAPTYLQMTARQGPEAIAWLPTTWLQSFVGIIPGSFGTTSTLACLLGAGLLLWWRVASGRIMAGVLFGMVGTVLLFNNLGNPGNAFFGLSWHWHLTLGSFAFGAVFLATDPVSAAMTNPGRWIYGFFIGMMIVLIRVGNPSHPDGVMFAILLGNIFAPLIDYLVVLANIRRRVRRGG
ncbi:MAG: NADH:ubiquinone reductase (Na(+)-transporting) subunit B [Gammaproteobacteria bacterium]|nr:NADH:ubiquinone reductase (Na(+)-transporting) subunit B [Gammaproteobacteria bacterium]